MGRWGPSYVKLSLQAIVYVVIVLNIFSEEEYDRRGSRI